MDGVVRLGKGRMDFDLWFPKYTTVVFGLGFRKFGHCCHLVFIVKLVMYKSKCRHTSINDPQAFSPGNVLIPYEYKLGSQTLSIQPVFVYCSPLYSMSPCEKK